MRSANRDKRAHREERATSAVRGVRAIVSWALAACAAVAVFAGRTEAQPCYEWQKLTAPDASDSDEFGVSLAMDGDTLVVAAWRDNDDRGALYVYEWDGAAWAFRQKLTAPDGMPEDRLGHPLAIQGDVIIAGAFLVDGVAADSGAAYFFRKEAGVWAIEQKLAPPGLDAGDEFGYDLALDGNVMAIGAFLDDLTGGRPDGGSVYIFNRIGNAWFLLQQIFAPDGEAGDRFGSAIDLEGSTLVVGAQGDDHPGGINEGGSAYVYTLQASSWLFSAKIVPPDPRPVDWFGGDSDGLDLDGDTLLISAHGNDDLGPDRGSVYFYQREGTAWNQIVKMYAAGNPNGPSPVFGQRLRLRGDFAVIGTRGWSTHASEAGAAHILQRISGRWSERVRLEASDGATDDRFGVIVDFNDRFAAVGAYRDDHSSLSTAGAVYIFRLVDCLGLPDCNGNHIDDREEIRQSLSTDINDNLIPDECEPGVCALPGGEVMS